MDRNYLNATLVERGGAPCAGLLLKNVYASYGSQFRRWYGITAPTSLLASIVLLMTDQRIRAIYGGIPRGEIQYHWGEISETYVLRLGGFFIAWLLGCFALAAIATVVNDLDADDGSEIWRRDSYQRAREHFGPLLSAALCTFCAFFAGVVVVGFVELALVRRLGLSHSWRVDVGVVLVGYILVASILSWFGMAIPLILSRDIGSWSALKRSVKLSNGYEGFLFLLVIESLAGPMSRGTRFITGCRSCSPPNFNTRFGIDGWLTRWQLWRAPRSSRQCLLASHCSRPKSHPICLRFQTPSSCRTSISCAMW